jgi:oligoendopeptidase F
MDAEDVALTMDIDITKKEFWISSLKTIEEDIDLFKELLK